MHTENVAHRPVPLMLETLDLELLALLFCKIPPNVYFISQLLEG